MKRYEVRLDQSARQSIEESADYIAEQSGNGRAEAWLRAMNQAIIALRDLPTMHRVVALRGGRPIRWKLVMSHRVFFFVDDDRSIVSVIDVVHTARETKLAEYRES